MGEWVDCKAWANVPIAIDWPQTAIGKFCTLFLRNTPTYLSLRYADGTEVTVPLLPENLSHPFPLAKIAVTPDEFVWVLKGGDARRPVAVRVWAESLSLYASELRFQ